MTGPRIRDVSPMLLVADVAKAAAYYADALGFTISDMSGDPPTFCTPQRDGVSVMLNQVGRGDSFRPNADYGGRYDAYFYVDDADALFEEFKSSGADIVCGPEDQPYLMRELQVRDPDGHLLAFGHDISGTVSHV